MPRSSRLEDRSAIQDRLVRLALGQDAGVSKSEETSV
jgi:hypothetical protein